MKKIITMLATVLIMSSMLFACTPPLYTEVDLDKYMEEVLGNTELNADASYTGNLVIGCNEEISENTILETFISEFNKKYPNITVSVKKYASSGYVNSLININATAIQTGKYTDMPDVFWMGNNNIPKFDALDMLMPINYFEKNDENFSFDSLVDIMLETCEYKDNTYLMPRDYNQVTMYINESIFEDADIALPPMDRQMTFDELIALCEQIKGLKTSNGDNIYPLDIPWNWDPVLWPVLKGNGGEVVKSVDGEIVSAINSDATFETYKMIKELQLDGYSAPMGGAANMFAMGRAAMTMHSRPTMPDILDRGYVTKMNAIPVPQFSENYYVGSGCSGYAMYKHSSNTTESWLFLKSMVSQESQNAFSATGSGIPVLKTLLENENAMYKQFTKTGMVSNFNHNAFIYGMGVYACTTDDYKKLVPYASVEGVSNAFEESISNCLQATNQMNYLSDINGLLKFIKACEKKINQELV